MITEHDDLRAVYGELRTVARALLRREPYAHTLESCELVHQAWAKVLHGDLRSLAEQEPRSVVALAVTNMRRELVDHARRRRAQKRPGGKLRVTLDDAPELSERQPELLLQIDQLLDELEAGGAHIRNAQRKAVCARYALYGGLSEAEIADALGLAKSTVGADVRFARAWLAVRLESAA